MMNCTIILLNIIFAICLPIYICAAEHHNQDNFKATNQCPQDIELVCVLPLPNEYTTIAPAISHMIRKGQSKELPLNTDLVRIKIGAAQTGHLIIEDKDNPILITQDPNGHFIVYQKERRHCLSLHQQIRREKQGPCSLQ